MDTSLQLNILLGFMLVGAIVAVETRDMLSAVICVGLVAFGTSVGFLILGAPDLAITQLVVEIICLVILIRATVVRDETVVHRPSDNFAVAAGGVALAAVLVACAVVYMQRGPGKGLPPMGDPVALRPYRERARQVSKDGRASRPEVRGVSRQYLDETRQDSFTDPGGARLHLPNRVTAIVLDYRGYDTLGEATVILTGIVGALVILRKRGKRDERDEPNS
jgi:multisubunit Na+/H+ antiporter MnhB subunit